MVRRLVGLVSLRHEVLSRPLLARTVAATAVLFASAAGCTGDDSPEGSAEDASVESVTEAPVPSEFVEASLQAPPGTYDLVQPFLGVDLSRMDCTDATAEMVEHYVNNYEASLQNELPLEPLAGYYTRGDEVFVAGLAAEENSPLFLLSAYGITLGFEDRVRGSAPGDWCPVQLVEDEFRAGLAASSNPELATVDSGATSASDAAAFVSAMLDSVYASWADAT